ncbi:hypothetical protein N8T08_000309 [Aspergillus melleus]|uniref:Uncharacterized protein n=1 Tax=Aspergillus melleus TaxID=138277 RepID=A0ACC3BB22_9EURO|nr:hypothetical protein N8T08_000309 [Aspergillus melleus]
MILGRYFTAIINFFGFPPSLGPQQEVLDPNVAAVHHDVDALTFIPPGVSESETEILKCEYPDLTGYEFVSGPDNRGQWLKSLDKSKIDYNISTDYETTWPKGVVRKYHVTVDEAEVTLDGVKFPNAKVFNKQWPGPWIQACWGDEVQITVRNNLAYNGTAIHMHGIRMLDSNLNDGVPGVTQCPIPPGQSFTYNFTATQYGTTWYHSHYSLQYTDGVLGPLTIHGPASGNFDNAIDPFIMGDHNHRSAFQDYYQEQFSNSKKNRPPPKMSSIIINGKGNYAGSYPERRYTKHVKPNERKLLRLINTSTDSTYIFSIDDHEFEVIGADLVPIEPYTTANITIGNGQRYHAILKTKDKNQLWGNQAYWIRTQPADGCHNFETIPDARQGILWYGDEKEAPIPTTSAHKYSAACRDEQGWKPILPWTIPKLAEGERKELDIPNSTIKLSHWLMPKERPDEHNVTVANWKAMENTAWVDYRQPTVYEKNLDPPYAPNAVVYPVEPNPRHAGGWHYMVIIGANQNKPTDAKGGNLIPAAHPIHLHGHDFALLQQSNKPFNGYSSLDLKYDNPPRRDVVLLPKNGFVVIAFKTDNPGPWVLHCHIAWHASAGLAFQALERKDAFKEQLEKRTPQWQKDQMEQNCKDWRAWQINYANHYDQQDRFQDDSGI